MFLTSASEWFAALVRRINVSWMSRISVLSCILARVQFISLWSAARYRSDHAVPACHLVRPNTVVRGVTWLLPSHSLPPIIQEISAWSDQFPSHVTSPVYIQTLHQEDRDTPVQTGSRSRTSSVGSSSHWGTGLGRGQLNSQYRHNSIRNFNCSKLVPQVC